VTSDAVTWYFKYMNTFTRNALFTGVIFAFSSTALLAYAASWDGSKAQDENLKWNDEILSWSTLVDSWNANRESLMQEYFGEVYENREYCDGSGCWSDDMFNYNYTANDGTMSNVSKSDIDADWNYTNGNTWYVANEGQALEFTGSGNERWESSNDGQAVSYVNSEGSKWESTNFGQGIVFDGVNGEHWESSNYGQGVNYSGAEGDSWDSGEDEPSDWDF